MARSRVLSAKFFTDGKLFDAEVLAGLPLRLAYEGLWCAADREGRFEWKPRELKLHVLPYDQVDFAAVLEALQVAGFIRYYEVEGKGYGYIPNFAQYQRIHPREATSILPNPPAKSEPQESPRQSQGTPKASPVQRKATPRCPASTSTSTSASTSEELLVATATNGVVSKKAKPPRDPPVGPPDWVNDAVEIYAKEIGYVAHGVAGRQLKPVVARQGWAEVKQVLEYFCEFAPYEEYLTRMQSNTLRSGEEKVKKLGYHTKLSTFVERYTYWANEAGVTP